MAKYETMMIFSGAFDEEAMTSVFTKFKTLIEKNGTMSSVEEWGKRKLAYPINDEADGYYVLFNFESAPEFPAELSRVAHITEGVLRLMTVAQEA